MGNTTAHRYLAESYATFSPRVSGQAVELVAGASVEYNDSEDDFLEGEEFPSDRLRYPGSAGRVTDYDGGSTGYNLVSFFSRANANIGERFIVSGAFRFDGSSRFGENNRYGVFPSASVAWMLGNESFFRRFEDQELTDDNFASKSRYGRANYGEEAGLGPTGLANPDLKWETTQEYDIGLDAQFFNGRLGFVADYYRKKTNDLLIERPIPSEGGLTTTWSNIGGIENKGWELAVNSTNVRPSDANGFRWESNFNVAANRNRVTELFDDQPFTTGFYNRVQEGQPLGAFYTLRFLGVDPLTGDAIFDDVNGDGDITADDETIVGSPHPDYFGGIGNTLSWRGLSLRAFVQFALGQEIFNAMREFADDGGRFSDNKFADVMKRWQQPGDITDVPRASSRNRSGAGTPSSRWIEDASYWRLQELTVSYNLPRRVSSLAGLRESRVFLTGYNLFTWTDYSGYSPEANSGGSNTNTFLGTDYYAAPLARTFSIGVSGAW
jgi:TonB-linked SusC/RagA family outer membrane protein